MFETGRAGSTAGELVRTTSPDASLSSILPHTYRTRSDGSAQTVQQGGQAKQLHWQFGECRLQKSTLLVASGEKV